MMPRDDISVLKRSALKPTAINSRISGRFICHLP
jgi:hypothetical protein